MEGIECKHYGIRPINFNTGKINWEGQTLSLKTYITNQSKLGYECVWRAR